MKKLYLLLLSFAFLFTKAQTDFRFADSTAQWNVLGVQYGVSFPSVSFSTDVYSITKDTLIKNISYQEIKTGYRRFYLRRDSLQDVYMFGFPDTLERRIYSFTKQPGDSFVVTAHFANEYLGCRIDSVDSLMMDKVRKRWFVTYFRSGFAGDVRNDIWVEGIGSTFRHFLYPASSAFTVDYSESLLCFSENGDVLYQDTTHQTCYLDTVVWLGVSKDFKLHPCITYLSQLNSLVVDMNTSMKENLLLSVYNLTGQLLLQEELTEQTTRIDVSALAKGVYLYEVVSGKQRVKSGKLPVQ